MYLLNEAMWCSSPLPFALSSFGMAVQFPKVHVFLAAKHRKRLAVLHSVHIRVIDNLSLWSCESSVRNRNVIDIKFINHANRV